MEIWWESISLLEQVFFVIAAPATLIILIQTVMLVFGGGFGDVDAGAGSDVSGFSGADSGLGSGSGGIDVDAPDFGAADGDISGADVDGLSLFSIRGIMSFFCVFGWSGYIMLGMNLHAVAAIGIAFVLGAAALYAMAYMIRGLMRLQESGTADFRSAVGKVGRVYLTIPASGKGQGKINVLLGESLREFWAVTNGDEPIPTGISVRIIDMAGGVFTVERENSEKPEN